MGIGDNYYQSSSYPITSPTDLIVEGNVGIGTSNPTQKLDIDGQIRIRGGSPGANKVLTSADASGNANWQTGGFRYVGSCNIDGESCCTIPGAKFIFLSGISYGALAGVSATCVVLNQGTISVSACNSFYILGQACSFAGFTDQ